MPRVARHVSTLCVAYALFTYTTMQAVRMIPLCAHVVCCMQCTSFALRMRLSHLTFRVRTIVCDCQRLAAFQQPFALYKELSQLRIIRASPTPGHESDGLTVTLRGWTVNPALLTILQHTPSVKGPVVCLFVLFLHSRLAETVFRYAQEYASLG